MRIEVIHARRLEQRRVTLDLPAGATVAQAVAASGLLDDLTQSDRDALATAVWGRVEDGSFVLEEGDRVELLRPLLADPKEARRARARARRGPQGGSAG